jgi:hypothetical protein
MKKISYRLVLGLAWSCLVSFVAHAQALVDVESGAVLGGKYNEVRVPGNGGTLFDIAKDFDTKPTFFYRIRVGYTFGKRHTVSALFAPLSVKSTGVTSKNINFNGANFDPDRPLDIRYQFNSYRLTYRYDFISHERFTLGLGLTAKIRDAAIELSNTQTRSEKTNLGVVPLVNFYINWQFADRLQLLLEGDALASPQGRAEDVFAGVGVQLADQWTLKAGYRLLEGGADNDEVYNFTWFNYASLGLIWRP